MIASASSASFGHTKANWATSNGFNKGIVNYNYLLTATAASAPRKE